MKRFIGVIVAFVIALSFGVVSAAPASAAPPRTRLCFSTWQEGALVPTRYVNYDRLSDRTRCAYIKYTSVVPGIWWNRGLVFIPK